MKITELFTSEEERAVSPVIGVILMVAITVILAAVIGTFVLGLGDQVQTTAPNAQFSFDYSSGEPATLDVTHDGGSGIDGGELYIMGDVATSDSWETAGHSEVRAGTGVTVGNGEDYEWADSVKIDDDGNNVAEDVDDDAEIRVVWQDSDSDQSSTLRTWTRN